MIMNLILLATMYPTMLIMWLVFRHMASADKTMVYGVHLRKEQRMDARVEMAKASYRKQTNLAGLIVMLIPPLFFLVHHVSIQFTLWMVWFMVALALLNVPYVRANKAMLELKQEYSIKDAVWAGLDGSQHLDQTERQLDQAVAHQLNQNAQQLDQMAKKLDQATKKLNQTAQQPREYESFTYMEENAVRTFKFREFLPQIVLSIIPLPILQMGNRISRIDQQILNCLEIYAWAVLIFAGVTILFALTAWLMDRTRSVVISRDNSVNTAYNLAKKRIWTDIWKQQAWLNAIVIVIIAGAALLIRNSFPIFMAAIVAETFLGIWILVRGTKKLMQVNRQYEAKKEDIFCDDDDRYWVWGMFYNNPNDKRTIVDKRFGIGTTTNMATPMGKVCIGIAVASLIWIPIMCAWIIMEDFTPMHIFYENDTLICSHLRNDYEIPLSDINEILLISELPEDRSKISGTGTDQIEKGKYTDRELGTYYTFVQCENEDFIQISTDDRIYIISEVDDEETVAVYERVRRAMIELD